MAIEPFRASKDYEKACFILTDRKLSRVVEVARERLERVKGALVLHESFQVNFRDGKELRLDSLQNVLALDNSHKNPITRILASLEIKADKENVEYGIQILFNSKDLYYEMPMSISGLSKELGWLQETMGAIEEQIERTIPRDFAYSFNRSTSAFFLGFFSVLIGLLSGILFVTQTNNSFQFSESRIAELVKLSSTATSETEKNDFVFRYLSATLEPNTRSEKLKRLFKETRTYFIGIPSLLAIISALIAIFWFYPRNIFSWGDCGENYEIMLERRKLIWYGVVLALVIGVLGNLFVIGATG